MADEHWPVATPRDEMLARVAARGTRIRAVRGALNALAVLTVVGVSTLGVGAAVRTVTDGSPATEVDNVAIGPEPPDVSAPLVTGGPADGSTSTTGGSGSTTTDDPADGRPSTTSGGGTGPGTTATTPSSGSGSTPGSSPTTGTSTTGTTTTAPSGTGVPATATTAAPSTTVPAPEVANVRMKADGVPIGLSVCEDEPESVVVVEIEGADTATMSWNRAGETRRVPMSNTSTDWQAPLGELDDQASDVPVLVTVEATGPGGTTRTSVAIEVADCSPLPSAPSEPGA